MKAYLIFPLLSSLLYVAAVLFVKRATIHGVGVWRTTFLANLVTALVFAPLLLIGGEPFVWTALWQPALVALLFLGGQLFTFLALETGDVSLVTPALGAKTVAVAWFSTLLLGITVPWQLWVAATLSFFAIALLHGGGEVERRPAYTILLSLVAAASFALFDVLVQKWAPQWGAGHFLPIMFCFAALFSFAFCPRFQQPLRQIPRPALPWLAAGSFLLAFQALGLILVLATIGDATAVNVIYSARGLWTVVAVWLMGTWLQQPEALQEPRVLRLRFLGAATMMAAIFLALTR